MREIKFRAKSLKTGEWVIGSYVHDEEWAKDYIFRQQLVGAFYQQVRHEIDAKTIGQFTGLHDKNGVEIWEGDFLLVPNLGFDPSEGESPSLVLAVGFEKGSFTIGTDFASEFEKEEIEVLGNQHEHPHLLTGESLK